MIPVIIIIIIIIAMMMIMIIIIIIKYWFYQFCYRVDTRDLLTWICLTRGYYI
jgi:hypothetical protein